MFSADLLFGEARLANAGMQHDTGLFQRGIQPAPPLAAFTAHLATSMASRCRQLRVRHEAALDPSILPRRPTRPIMSGCSDTLVKIDVALLDLVSIRSSAPTMSAPCFLQLLRPWALANTATRTFLPARAVRAADRRREPSGQRDVDQRPGSWQLQSSHRTSPCSVALEDLHRIFECEVVH